MKKKNLFRKKVIAVVKKISKGKIMTYGEVAKKAGHAGAARAVGAIVRANYDLSIPCHRVIGAGGKVTGYNRGGAPTKIKKLRSEGYKGMLIQ